MSLSRMRKAVNDYGMINAGDIVYCAVSGGKDSMLMLACLVRLSKFHHIPFTVEAVHVDMGFEGSKAVAEGIADACSSLGAPFHCISTDIAKIVFELRNEKNPCALCSKMRKGALYKYIAGLGGSKAALGHHADDYIATFLLSLLYEGRLSSFKPVTYLDRSGISVIRPLIYMRERDIVHEANLNNLAVFENNCPNSDKSERKAIAQLAHSLNKQFPHAEERILNALFTSEHFR
ncbi:MAG: tRNA 2-thiocytidine(32) synthetase TtcA [Eubacteriaceae bacterium]|nr:tRNA 2-thiocytidine(32) synthetase TtcA [Eubacteriaceae bacterium]